MAKDKETPETATEPKEELTGWQKLHQDYLKRKAQEEEERKKKEDEERRRILKPLPDKQEETKKDKKKKKAKKDKKKAEKPSKRKAPRPSNGQVLRSLPIFLVAGLGILLSVYFMSPLATAKTLQVSGNQVVDQQQILERSGIQNQDYTLTTFLSQTAYERNITESSPWIRSTRISYSFPTTFRIQISEYGVIAYQSKDGKSYPILTSGTIINQEANPDANQILVQFDDTEKIKDLAGQLDKLSSDIRSQIQTISLTPSKASQDLLTLDMRDNNQVLVPLSELDKKLAYYPSVTAQIAEPSIVDMESGIFSYTKASAEAQAAAQQEQSAAQDAENQEANSDAATSDASQADATAANPETGT